MGDEVGRVFIDGCEILASCFSSSRKPASGPVISAAVCFVRSAAIRPGAAPSGSRWMPSCPSPWRSRVLGEPIGQRAWRRYGDELALEVSNRFDRRVDADDMQRSRGAPSIAAIASAGDPLAAKAMPGPLPRPKSMPPQPMPAALCRRPLARRFYIENVSANMPEATPTSAGRNSNKALGLSHRDLVRQMSARPSPPRRRFQARLSMN